MKQADVFKLRTQLESMKGRALGNYVLPGLTSTLLDQGKLRLFESSRDTPELITPHSHRFDFWCFVLAGSVQNTVYTRALGTSKSDTWAMSELLPKGAGPGGPGLGRYEKQTVAHFEFVSETNLYIAGEAYSMLADDIHSIKFSKCAEVLFIEGPERSAASVILEPVVDGVTVPTFKVEPWMFKELNTKTHPAD